MNTTLTTEVSLADAVYKIAELARTFELRIERVQIETSDQGEYLTVDSVQYVSPDEETLDSDGEPLENVIGYELAQEMEDWANQLSWDDAGGDATGWHTTNARGGYYYIDVDEALAAEAPVEIKPVDLVTGVLALHIMTHTPLAQNKRLCLCGAEVTDMVAFRQHVAEKVVEVLS